MMNVFVFPCGSEIALEIARSLSGDRHFHLIGGASVRDHGRFAYEDIVEDVPWLDDASFIPFVKRIVSNRHVDLIYPATDAAIVILKRAEAELGCRVVTSPLQTAEICFSKRATYAALADAVRTPQVFDPQNVQDYPVFGKPDVGHSSRGVAVLSSEEEKAAYLSKNPNSLLLELLPGEEYTVDCFSDRSRRLLFAGARKRARTMGGISISTAPVSEEEQKEFLALVAKINAALVFRGAWFAQFKRAADGRLVLMEIAARFGGSSGLFRGLGVNFALLSLWDALECDVSVMANRYSIEMDRALGNKYRFGIQYNEVFLDYDDTIVMSADGKVNPSIMRFVFVCRNRGFRVSILSRHRGDLGAELQRHGIDRLFSRVIHIPEAADKSDYIDNPHAIFIDDSYAERNRVLLKCQIPVFGLDMVDALCDS